jgi:deazaflavin-dependent oxidoreductase (nitroreductase family)
MVSPQDKDPRAVDAAFRMRSGSHVARYVASGGEQGYDDNPHEAPTLLLTTTGRRSGNPSVAPLYFAEDGGRYIVIASKGGDDRDPQWYLNLVANPAVDVQIRDKTFRATARTADPDEKARLWPLLADHMPFYNTYQQNSARDIPLVILQPVEA